MLVLHNIPFHAFSFAKDCSRADKVPPSRRKEVLIFSIGVRVALLLFKDKMVFAFHFLQQPQGR